ncbi:MAG: TIGR02302 family protein [Rhodoblastus sp.]|nr:TIGR02302 family protein [Rhodoblastus sp.]
MASIDKKLNRLVASARVVLAWEFLWRAFSTAAGVFALFLAASWFGLWELVPPAARPFGMLAFAIIAIAAIARGGHRETLTRRAALKRIDRDAGDRYAAASTLDDSPANSDDPTAMALWRVHQARLVEKLRRVRLARPAPRAIERDSRALRAGALLLAAVAAVYAGPDRAARLATALTWSGQSNTGAQTRIDAWIDPPPYTGKPPLMLTGARPSEALGQLSAPIGSTVVVRSAGQGSVEAVVEGGLAQIDDKSRPARRDERESRFVLKGDGRLKLGGETFDIAAIPDSPPTVELLEQPRANLRGTLGVFYRADDDYGVVGLEARISDPEIQGRVVRDKPLIDAPHLPLALPAGSNGVGEAHSTLDFSESPWAGVRVSFRLVGRDASGSEGATTPISIYLPQRPFTKPLARALVEQRRNLVLAPGDRRRVAAALDALMLEPEKFSEAAGVYLGLRIARSGLTHARSSSDLLETADLLWAMALQIEDGGTSDAERELRAAERNLRDALQKNASPEEIARLTQALRQAMDRFLAEMARRQPDRQQRTEADPDQRSRSISRDQLQKMLEQMESMARSGDMANAQDMLDRLQDILENLRTARRRPPPSQEQREMRRALSDLDRLMHDQQELRDDTYRNGQKDLNDSRSQRRPPSDRNRSLKDRQADLERRLGDIQRRLGKNGNSKLGGAGEAMKQAEGELGEGGDRDKAVDAQGRALEAMRNGAEQLAQDMRNRGNSSEQAGDDEGPAMGEGGGQERDEADPLGRPRDRRRRFDPNARYDPLGATPALRAQRVLEELRRRLGENARPRDELDYLERLIRR